MTGAAFRGWLAMGSVLVAGCASAFVLHPSTGASAREGRRIFVDGPDGRLEVLVERRGGADRCRPSLYVLEFIGNSGRADGSSLPSRIAQSAPMEVWVVNYPGFGSSEGRPRLRAINPAARAVFDAIAERAGDRPVVTYGFSLGSIPALHLAGTRPVGAAIMRNVPCVVDLILTRWAWWNLWLAALPTAAQVPPSFGCRWNARRARAPGLFLMSERDAVCPLRYQEITHRAYAGPSRAVLMRGASHGDEVPDAAQDEAVRWLAEAIGNRLEPSPEGCPNGLARTDR